MYLFIHVIILSRLQEIVSDDRREAGRIPRTIDCELTADLVDSCVTGDMVTITAVVKATGSHDDSMMICVHCNSCINICVCNGELCNLILATIFHACAYTHTRTLTHTYTHIHIHSSSQIF